MNTFAMMQQPDLSVRPITKSDVEHITNYWLTADEAFLHGMGADITKMPSREEWIGMLEEQVNTPLEQKKSYAIIMLVNGVPSGHCNINKITPGIEAHMHLHLWNKDLRKQGIGAACVKMALPYFFNSYNLQKVCSEPYAHNPAPNKALEKLGFNFIKQYTTTPGWINFEQEVNLWELPVEKFRVMYP
jgi:RimJ/RimL family protein N-acetyltransferase